MNKTYFISHQLFNNPLNSTQPIKANITDGLPKLLLLNFDLLRKMNLWKIPFNFSRVQQKFVSQSKGVCVCTGPQGKQRVLREDQGREASVCCVGHLSVGQSCEGQEHNPCMARGCWPRVQGWKLPRHNKIWWFPIKFHRKWCLY